MLVGCLQPMGAHLQVIWLFIPHYLQRFWAELPVTDGANALSRID